MTQGSEGENSSLNDENAHYEAAGEKQRVAKTRLDINMGDLIEPLTDELGSKEPGYLDESQTENRVSKTLLETDGPSLEQIKELSESGRYAALAKESDSAKLKKSAEETDRAEIKKLAKTIPEPQSKKKRETDKSVQAEAKEDNISLKKLAKTIPEPKSQKGKSEAISNQKEAVSPHDDDAVPLKQLAKTIPDPQMQQRKAVAARIKRIQSFQKTVQVKRPKFSKTMADSDFEVLDTLRENDQWQAPAKSAKAPSAPQKVSPVREQFVVARTQLDHNILFRAVSESKIKEEVRVAQLLVEKAKETPKPPPVPVKADRASSACPFKWEGTDSKDKYRYCNKCQTPIYNFEGMERPEAEALIFNRENRDKFTLYSREDGKFMTADCPVQKTRMKNLIMSLIAAIALVIGAAALLIFMPRPPAETATNSTTSATSDSDVVTFSSTSSKKTSRDKKSAPVGSSAGSGTGYQRFKLPNGTQQQSQGPDPDEDGHMWKFD